MNRSQLQPSPDDEVSVSVALLSHLQRTGYQGLDPSLIKFHPRIRAFHHSLPNGFAGRLCRSASSRLIDLFSHPIAIGLRVVPVRLAKCVSLSALAWLSLFKRTGDVRFLSNGLELTEDLLGMSLEGGFLWSHGVPYEIRNEDVSATTPNLVTTFFALQALHGAARVGNRSDWLARFRASVERASACFPAVRAPEGHCFMYTPATTYHVHNANLMMVQLMAQYWDAGGTGMDPEIAVSALRYSLRDFARKRAIPYAGAPTPRLSEDNYHTGYVIRSLREIRRSEAFEACRPEIDEVLSFAVQRYWDLFCPKGHVVRDKTGKIHAHSLAEALLIRKTCEWPPGVDPERIDAAIERTRKRLWNRKEGRFHDSVTWICGVPIANKVDYPRWAQAWMAYALARPRGTREPI